MTNKEFKAHIKFLKKIRKQRKRDSVKRYKVYYLNAGMNREMVGRIELENT